MKKNRVIALWLSLMSLCSAMTPVMVPSINFGSKGSAIVVNNNAALDIDTKYPMIINNGNLVNTGNGQITGQEIRFNEGVYTFFNSTSNVQGGLIPTGNVVILDNTTIQGGGTMIANPGGLAGVSVQAKPGINLLRGQPLFFGLEDIRLKDNTTLLAVAVQNTVNTNIRLNGGVLFLQDDLRLGDLAVIVDSGIVAFNDRRMLLGGGASTWFGTIIWDGSGELQVNSKVNLNGNWIFDGTAQLNGNGNVIDLTAGGSIIVPDNSTLRLASVHVKGIGHKGKILLGNNATLFISDVTLEMDRNYNVDSGTLYVEGNSDVITKQYFLSFVDGPNGSIGKLIVDDVAFSYDTLASIDQLNVQPQLIRDPMRRHVEIFGEGEIRTIRADTISFHNYVSEPVLQKYAIVAPYRMFEVFPTVDNLGNYDYNVILDGNTNFLGFTFTEEGVFTITTSVQAITQNIFLRDFSPNHMIFEPGSSLVFGNNTMMTLARNETLNYQWVLQDSVILKGSGNILELGPQGSIVLQGPNARLLLDGITLTGIQGNNISCLDDSSVITLQDVTWIQSGDFDYPTGGLEILGNVTMPGGLGFAFNYLSDQPITILPISTLSLIRNMIFNYAPLNGATNLIQLTDPTSVLSLDLATLLAPTGLNISSGRVVIREQNFVQGNVTFSGTVLLDQPSGATLQQSFS